MVRKPPPEGRVCVHISVFVCVHEYKTEDNLECPSSDVICILVEGQGLSVTRTLTSGLHWLPVGYPPISELRCVHCHAWLLTQIIGVKLRAHNFKARLHLNHLLSPTEWLFYLPPRREEWFQTANTNALEKCPEVFLNPVWNLPWLSRCSVPLG